MGGGGVGGMQSCRGARSTVVSTPGQEALRDHVVAVFGSKAASGLQAVALDLGCGVRAEGCIAAPFELPSFE